MAGRVFVIGISGTTNSGKSTLVHKLVKHLPNCTRVCQDHFFLEPGDSRLEPLRLPELNHHNWEDFRALEMDKMVDEVKAMVSKAEQTIGDKNVYFFVEGFCIFGWRPLLSLLDQKYFLTVSKEVCFERRKKRNYNPPDVPGYFDQIVWPQHLAHLKHIKDQDDIVYLDGNDGVDHVFTRMCSDIELLTKSKNTIS